MRLGLVLALGFLLIFVSLLVRSRLPTVYEPPVRALPLSDATPVCPWRDPSSDLPRLFPPATNYFVDNRTLSGAMMPVQKQLGRVMAADENPLRIYRVTHQGCVLGSVLVGRAKGEHGGIELVLGVDTNAVVRGLLIQSQREPEPVARTILSPEFLASFKDKNAASALRIGQDLSAVPANALASAQAIADAVRSRLVLLSFAERSPETREPLVHSHH